MKLEFMHILSALCISAALHAAGISVFIGRADLLPQQTSSGIRILSLRHSNGYKPSYSAPVSEPAPIADSGSGVKDRAAEAVSGGVASRRVGPEMEDKVIGSDSFKERDSGNPSDAFERKLFFHLSRFKRYPLRALRRGIQGTAVVDIEILRDGALKTAKLISSSGNSGLDAEALELAKRADPFPAMPDKLKGNYFRFSVPLRFRLGTD